MDVLPRRLASFALALAMLVLVGCAGDLENPERFDFLLGGDAAVGMPAMPGDGDGDASGDGDGDADPGGDGDGDSAGDGDGDAIADDLPACLSMVIAASCGSAGCHAAGQAQTDLVSPGLVDRLLDRDAETSPFCPERKLISTDGSGSLLLDKLDPAVECGSPMPLVGQISEADKQCLTDWVESLGGDLPGSGS